jgi:type II secretory pathway pseudopilin PulG
MRLNKDGFISGLAVAVLVLSIVAILAIVFGIWAYNGREKYKNNTDQLIAAAVANEKNNEAALLQKQFSIEQQNPYVTYTGPQEYGTVQISYPKTWSGYVDTSGADGNPVDGYFNPGVVPAIGSNSSIFALRLQINSNVYSTNLANYTAEQQSNNLTIVPYALKRVPSVVGVMISGQILPNAKGILVMLPLRTTTLEIWTESMQYANQFTSQILPSVTFRP